MNAKDNENVEKPYEVTAADGTIWHALPDSDEAWKRLLARHAIDIKTKGGLPRLAFCLSNTGLYYGRGPVQDLVGGACDSCNDDVDKFVVSAESACRSRRRRPTSDIECVRDLTRAVWPDDAFDSYGRRRVPLGIRDADDRLLKWRPIAPSDPSGAVAARCGVSLRVKGSYTDPERKQQRALDALRSALDRRALCRATADMPKDTLLGQRLDMHCPKTDATVEYMNTFRLARQGGLTSKEAFCVADVSAI